MTGFIEGESRAQATLFPERLDDYITESNPIRVIDVFVDELDLGSLSFKTVPEDTGRPPYHPATLLKIYIYGYLNRVQSSRRLEREAQRNVELMWLTERLAPDFKTIADFRKDNGKAIQKVCREFVLICRKLELFTDAFVAIDGSKNETSSATDRREHCPLSVSNCERRPPGHPDSQAHIRAPSGQDYKTQKGSEAAHGTGKGNAQPARPANIADRPRCTLYGNQWPRQWHGWL
jgi:transposase